MVRKKYNPRISGMYRRSASASFALASGIYQGLCCELGSKAQSLLRKKDYSGLLNLEVNPSEYTDAESFRDDYLISSLMSKYPNFDIPVDREKVALEKFRSSEEQCSASNRRIGRFVSSINSLYTVESIFWSARLKIASLLGPFSWDQAEHHFAFGPGSTTSLPRRKGDAYFKFGAAKPHVTKECSVLAMLAIKRIPRWYSHLAGLAGESLETLETLPIDACVDRLLTIVPGNRVTTVPKNAKTDRVIAIEPDLNMFVQKGIGAMIRSRLKRVSVDLDDQTRNQSLAKEGSLTGTLATLDLSSASDTVSMKLVEELLPVDWVSAIKLSRSPMGVLPDGTTLLYQKVSSMGNGFTFELESLIFWALCSAVISLFKPRESRLAVYGDDIIVSSEVYHTIVWVLSYAGFTANVMKSFSCGPFRESCGKHFFAGVDVTPFYIREDVATPDRIIWFANQTRRWARHPIWGLDGRLHDVYSLAVQLLPRSLQQPSIPDGFGDSALIGDFDECRPSWSRRLQCYEAVGVADVRATFVPGGHPYLLRALSILERSKKVGGGGSSGLILDHKRTWRPLRFPVAQWESYGGWLTL